MNFRINSRINFRINSKNEFFENEFFKAHPVAGDKEERIDYS